MSEHRPIRRFIGLPRPSRERLFAVALVGLGIVISGTSLAETATSATATSSAPAASLVGGPGGYCAITRSGSLLCWGNNEDGQLGDGTSGGQSNAPVAVSNLSGVKAVSGGDFDWCAIANGDTVWCWGNEPITFGHSNVPMAVAGVTGATSIVSAGDSDCALVKSGAVECWGVGSNGQLGDGASQTSSATAVQVKGLSGAKSLATDYESAYCALLASGHVSCWGDNSAGGSAVGQLGNGGNEAISAVPVTVKGLSNAVSLVGGTDGFCAVLHDGQAMCWGDNSAFELGNDSGVAYAPAPVTVKGLSTAVELASSYYGYCALLKSGSAECWGSNGASDFSGELGDGNTKQNFQSLVLVTVKGLTGANNLLGETANGGYCARLTNGTAKCWGTGLLGNGSSGSSAVPVAVKGLSNIASLATDFDSDSVCALLKSGAADCWGEGYGGELGDGEAVSANVPAPVVGLS